jgi:hypothetical protein
MHAEHVARRSRGAPASRRAAAPGTSPRCQTGSRRRRLRNARCVRQRLLCRALAAATSTPERCGGSVTRLPCSSASPPPRTCCARLAGRAAQRKRQASTRRSAARASAGRVRRSCSAPRAEGHRAERQARDVEVAVAQLRRLQRACAQPAAPAASPPHDAARRRARRRRHAHHGPRRGRLRLKRA